MKIIIAVCTYKRHASLERCVLSMRNMTIPDGCDVEFVVVDNEPCNKIMEICHKYQLTYRVEQNRGLTFARNHTLDYARYVSADYLGVVDDDEELSKEWLCDMINGFKHTNADVLAGTIDIVSDNSKIPPYLLDAYQFSKVKDYKIVKTLPMGNVMFGKKILQSGLVFDRSYNFTGGEDINFFLKASQQGFRLVKSPNANVREYLMPEKASLYAYFKRQLRVSELHYRKKYPDISVSFIIECAVSLIEIFIALLLLPVTIIHDKSKIISAKYFAKGLGRFLSRKNKSQSVYGQ